VGVSQRFRLVYSRAARGVLCCRPMRRWSLPTLAVTGPLITSLGCPSPAEACEPNDCMDRPAFAGETLPPGTRKVPLPINIWQVDEKDAAYANHAQLRHDGEPVAGRVERVAGTPIFVADAPLADGRYEYVPDPRDLVCDGTALTFEVGGEVPPRPVRTGTLSVVKSFEPAADHMCGPEHDTEYAKVLLELPEHVSSWKALTRIRIDVIEAPTPAPRRSYDVSLTRATSTGELFSAECSGESFEVAKYKVRYTAILVDEDESLEPVEVAFDLDCSSAPSKAPQRPSNGPEGPSNGPEQGLAPDAASGCSLAAPLGAPSWPTLAALVSAAALVAVRRRARAGRLRSS